MTFRIWATCSCSVSKAVQTASVEGNWVLAQHLELIPMSSTKWRRPAKCVLRNTRKWRSSTQEEGALRPPGIRPGRRQANALSPQATPGFRCHARNPAEIWGAKIDGASHASLAGPPTDQLLQSLRNLSLWRRLGPGHRQPRPLFCRSQLSGEDHLRAELPTVLSVRNATQRCQGLGLPSPLVLGPCVCESQT